MSEDNEQPLPQILCVDDEKAILKSLRRVLMDEDCEVLTAPSGAEGLDVLNKETNVALIISDQRMPEMTGVEFLQQAKAITPSAYRVMLTGYADINATMDAVNHGEIWRYITKPWDDEQLVFLVRDAIRHYNLENENLRLHGVIEKKNKELQQWNDRLKQRVLSQTNLIREKHENLAKQNRALRESFEQNLLAFSDLTSLRDKSLRNHSFSTAAIATKAAQLLKLEVGELQHIRAAALLHGIGKLAIADTLLKKPEEELTPSEKIIFNSYTVRSQTAISPINELQEAGKLIRHITEEFNGSGSPDHLKGDQIPLGSRIIAIAKYIDRKFNSGTYGIYGVLEQVIKSCDAQAGTRFDADLVPIVSEAARLYYSESKSSEPEDIREELYPMDLRVGMVVLRDVYSGTGILLLKQGSTLSSESISALKRYYDTDPPDGPVLTLKADQPESMVKNIEE